MLEQRIELVRSAKLKDIRTLAAAMAASKETGLGSRAQTGCLLGCDEASCAKDRVAAPSGPSDGASAVMANDEGLDGPTVGSSAREPLAVT